MLKLFVFVLVLAFLGHTYAHVALVGARPPGTNTAEYIKDNNMANCGNGTYNPDFAFNVTAGDLFTITWALFVNHNMPPQPEGTVSFNWAVTDQGPFTSVSTNVPVSTQPAQAYVPATFIIPSTGFDTGVLQVLYSTNGATMASPMYYQCIDFFVSS